MNKNLGLKYHSDHEMLMSMLSDEKLNVELFKIYRDYEGLKKLKTCIFCDKQKKSNGIIIKAHSISKNKVLRNISNKKNGTYIVGKFKKTNTKNPNPLEQKIDAVYEPINSASTFTGLCKYHDNILFKEIDNDPYETGSYKNIFQYTLRNCIYQFYDRSSNLIGANLRNRLISSQGYHKIGNINIIIEGISNQLDAIEKDLIKLINYSLNGDIHNKILYKIFKFKTDINIAGNIRFIYYKDVFYFTFIPGKQNSFVLVSCLRKDNIFEMNYFFDYISSLSNQYFELFLSDLLLSATSIRHYFFNYTKYNELDVNKQALIKTWLDYENFESPLGRFNRYKILGDVPNFFRRMSL